MLVIVIARAAQNSERLVVRDERRRLLEVDTIAAVVPSWPRPTATAPAWVMLAQLHRFLTTGDAPFVAHSTVLVAYVRLQARQYPLTAFERTVFYYLCLAWSRT